MNIITIKEESLEFLVTTCQASKCNICIEELYLRYFPKLESYCNKLTRSKDDGYDLAIEAFIKATDKIHTLKIPEYFSSWLFRIAHNLFMDKVRWNKRFPTLNIGHSFDLIDDTSEQDRQIEREELLKQTNTMLELVEPEIKYILVAKYINNNSIAEIKDNLGITESATKMRLARARKRIASMAS